MPTTKTISSRLTELFSTSRLLSFSRYEIIIRADDVPQGVHYLEKGYVKMNSTLSDGREITLNIFKPGSYFPMMWALGDLPNNYYFQAMSPVTLRRIPKNTFLTFINSNPDVLLELTSRILIGVDSLLFNINHILSGDSYHRIIAAIVMLSKRFGQKTSTGKIIITIPLIHQDLADIAAITRETTSINIKKLENRDLISQADHNLTINNLQKLEIESEVENLELSSAPPL